LDLVLDLDFFALFFRFPSSHFLVFGNLELLAGKYILMLSTYFPDIVMKFRLRVEGSVATLAPVQEYKTSQLEVREALFLSSLFIFFFGLFSSFLSAFVVSFFYSFFLSFFLHVFIAQCISSGRASGAWARVAGA
jgi:hypothetical protein